MNNLQLFNNTEFGNIRAITVDGVPWLVGKDVAEALGYEKARNAIAAHVDEEDALKQGIPTEGGIQEMTIINESGLYSLIMSSKLPKAKSFKRWVTSEVLPSLRQTGSYTMPGADVETERTIRIIKEVVPDIVAAAIKGVQAGQTGATAPEAAPKRPRLNYHGKIDRLPPGLRNKVIEMLFFEGHTLEDVSDWLKDQGHDASRMSVSRYAHKMRDKMNDSDWDVSY